MPVQVTHNNDGHFYTIDVDIAKEGAQVFDLSTYFKARVADNHTGLRVRWFWQGQIFNTVGKKPRVEGVVGQYSFKKGTNGTRELVMSPDASPVASDGDVSACEPGGYATYYFPGQMFPQEGLFKGTIGLVDDLDEGAHYTSVDIWFKVYPQAGGAQMGRACDFYISELDKAIKEAEDDLTAAKKSMQKVVDDFTAKMNDLSNQITTQANTDKAALAALETRIEQDNIVTKPQLDAFKQAVKMQTINVFDSVDDMKHNASSLSEGMKVRTIAYYDNQGEKYGGCLYEIKKDKTDLPAIDFENGLYAVPILEHNRVMNAACFGIKVNAEDDQADAIQTFLNSVPYNHKAYFPAGSYVLGHGIKIPGGGELFGDTTNTLNASWNGTAFFFKGLPENTVAIDAHDGGKQTVRNIWVEIDGAYSFAEDRTKAKTTTDNKMVSPFTITKSTSGIVGIYIGGYGSIAKDNVVVGASEAGIDSDAFCEIRNNQVWDSLIGIRTKSDMQVSGNRVQHCEFGLELDGAECNVVNERYDSISEMGFLLKEAHGSNLVNVQVDYCGGPGIMLNDTGNCHISTQIGRTGICYAGTESDDLDSPTFAAGVALTGNSSYNRIDVTQDYTGIFDNGTPDVRAPRYKVVTGQYYDAADTHAYHNDITISGGGFDIYPGKKLTVDQLKRFMFIAGPANHVMFSGSLTIYGLTYYYNVIDSAYNVGSINQLASIGYNDTPATTLNTLNIKGNIYGDEVIAENMDSLTSTGIYGWNGYALTKSVNLPPEKDLGVLLVMNTDDKVTQSILGCNTVQSRVYSGTSWSSWKKATLA